VPPVVYKTVYKATHNKYGDVVLKIVKPSKDKPESIARIKREIRASEIIESDHIPRIFASDVTGEDIWIIEEYINGETLRDVINSKKIFLFQKFQLS